MLQSIGMSRLPICGDPLRMVRVNQLSELTHSKQDTVCTHLPLIRCPNTSSYLITILEYTPLLIKLSLILLYCTTSCYAMPPSAAPPSALVCCYATLWCDATLRSATL